MDAVPIVPPLFQGTKNTTLHELQTADRSRATDNADHRLLPLMRQGCTLFLDCDDVSRRRSGAVAISPTLKLSQRGGRPWLDPAITYPTGGRIGAPSWLPQR